MSPIVLPGGQDLLSAAAYARGAVPVTQAVVRAEPADFAVTERLAFDLSGEGEHLWLRIEKTGRSTPEVAAALAAHYGVRPRDVGYAGLKDRRARTVQWFSLPAPVTAPLPAPPTDEGLVSLEAVRHRRKLRRGAHSGNGFELVLRRVDGDRDRIEQDLDRIRHEGCPNYFGGQRFGRDNGNIALAQALLGGRRMRRGTRRGMALSAARADLFNAVLAARVADGSWNRLLVGEAAALDGSRSVFPVADPDDPELARRLAEFDIHPSGPLPGRGGAVATDAAATVEDRVLEPYAAAVTALAELGVDADRRPLRLHVRELAWEWRDGQTLVLRFELPRGSFATALLREIAVF